MASVVRRFRRNAAAGRAAVPGLMFRAVSRLRGRWALFAVERLESKYARPGRLSKEEYRFYGRRTRDLTRWQAGKS